MKVSLFAKGVVLAAGTAWFLVCVLAPFCPPAAVAAENSLNAFRRKPSGKSAGPPATKSEIVVAEVNGRRITLAAVEAYLQGLPPEVGLQALKDARRFLEEFVQTELLFREALRRKVDISPEVQARIRFSRRQILIEELVKRLVAPAERVSDEEAREFFQKNRGRFQREETVRLSHIVLKTEQDAMKALAELRSGVSFEEVAGRRSIFESSRQTGGQLGLVRRGELDREMEKAAFSMPLGKVSQPIQTPVGWQIIRVTERAAASKARFEDVKNEVKKMLGRRRGQAEYRALLERLRRENKVIIYPERLR